MDEDDGGGGGGDNTVAVQANKGEKPCHHGALGWPLWSPAQSDASHLWQV